jgi:hypothetical protein
MITQPAGKQGVAPYIALAQRTLNIITAYSARIQSWRYPIFPYIIVIKTLFASHFFPTSLLRHTYEPSMQLQLKTQSSSHAVRCSLAPCISYGGMPRSPVLLNTRQPSHR